MPPKIGNNPVDSYRKAQKKQEIKKSKDSKGSGDKNAKLAYADTFLLEIEVKSLEERSSKETLDKNLAAHFTQLKEELAAVRKAKEAFVEEHPEKKGEVYKHLSAPSAQAQAALARRRDEQPKQNKVQLNKKGLPLYPTKSVYYDPTYNPTGVPPPGMPYAEKSSDEDDSDDDDDDDDDIPMPKAPKPQRNNRDDDSDDDLDDLDDLDDIPMPTGPPPGMKPATATAAALPQPPQPPTITDDDKRKAQASATISSAPQMRDLHKESATLLPAQLMRKKR